MSLWVALQTVMVNIVLPSNGSSGDRQQNEDSGNTSSHSGSIRDITHVEENELWFARTSYYDPQLLVLGAYIRLRCCTLALLHQQDYNSSVDGTQVMQLPINFPPRW